MVKDGSLPQELPKQRTSSIGSFGTTDVSVGSREEPLAITSPDIKGITLLRQVINVVVPVILDPKVRKDKVHIVLMVWSTTSYRVG